MWRMFEGVKWRVVLAGRGGGEGIPDTLTSAFYSHNLEFFFPLVQLCHVGQNSSHVFLQRDNYSFQKCIFLSFFPYR